MSSCLGKPFHSFHSIPYYSKPFNFLILQSIPFHFFSTIFFNFPNPYTISLNLNHLYHLEIHKVKLFSKLFFKPFSNYLEWSKMVKMISPNGGYSINKYKTHNQPHRSFQINFQKRSFFFFSNLKKIDIQKSIWCNFQINVSFLKRRKKTKTYFLQICCLDLSSLKNFNSCVIYF